MLTASAKNKGRELENWIVSKLRNSGLDPRASRNPGSGSGKQKGDVWNALGLCIEAKNTKKCPGKAEFDQLARESMGYGVEVLVWHAPNTSLEDSRAIVNFNDLIELLKKAHNPTPTDHSRDLKFKIARLKQLANEVAKEL